MDAGGLIILFVSQAVLSVCFLLDGRTRLTHCFCRMCVCVCVACLACCVAKWLQVSCIT